MAASIMTKRRVSVFLFIVLTFLLVYLMLPKADQIEESVDEHPLAIEVQIRNTPTNITLHKVELQSAFGSPVFAFPSRPTPSQTQKFYTTSKLRKMTKRSKTNLGDKNKKPMPKKKILPIINGKITKPKTTKSKNTKKSVPSASGSNHVKTAPLKSSAPGVKPALLKPSQVKSKIGQTVGISASSGGTHRPNKSVPSLSGSKHAKLKAAPSKLLPALQKPSQLKSKIDRTVDSTMNRTVGGTKSFNKSVPPPSGSKSNHVKTTLKSSAPGVKPASQKTSKLNKSKIGLNKSVPSSSSSKHVKTATSKSSAPVVKPASQKSSKLKSRIGLTVGGAKKFNKSVPSSSGSKHAKTSPSKSSAAGAKPASQKPIPIGTSHFKSIPTTSALKTKSVTKGFKNKHMGNFNIKRLRKKLANKANSHRQKNTMTRKQIRKTKNTIKRIERLLSKIRSRWILNNKKINSRKEGETSLRIRLTARRIVILKARLLTDLKLKLLNKMLYSKKQHKRTTGIKKQST